MMIVEVFADITCPFTHVGLKRVVHQMADMDRPIELRVRAWPLEWVNGVPLDVEAVEAKARVLSEQLGVDDFRGLRADHWPQSTIPALAVAAAAYEHDATTGLKVSLVLRSALFEGGLDVGDDDVLRAIASDYGLPDPSTLGTEAVQADYDEGRRRGVDGSPHFWVGEDDFFCPALDLGHDADGNLTSRLDTDGLAAFFDRLDR